MFQCISHHPVGAAYSCEYFNVQQQDYYYYLAVWLSGPAKSTWTEWKGSDGGFAASLNMTVPAIFLDLLHFHAT